MQLNLTYDPNNSEINVLEDVKNILNQLSDCYNSKINDLEQEIATLKEERNIIRLAAERKDFKTLYWYLTNKELND